MYPYLDEPGGCKLQPESETPSAILVTIRGKSTIWICLNTPITPFSTYDLVRFYNSGCKTCITVWYPGT